MNNRRGNEMSWRIYVGIFLFLGMTSLAHTNSAFAGIADHVVINELGTDSVQGAGGSYDDWIELYNPSDADVSLDTWSIQKQSSASSSQIYKKTLSGIIRAKSFYLIVRGDASTAQGLKDMANILTASTFSLSDDNVVYLVNNDVAIENQADINIVDYVGLGASESFEGQGTAANPAETKSVSRTNDGEDTDNNNLDFVIMDVPTKKNASSTQDTNPDFGGLVLLTISKDLPPVQNIDSVSADIVYTVNGSAKTKVNYGLNTNYALASTEENVLANTKKTVTLSNLSCDTLYHYSIRVQNQDASDTYDTADAVFQTLPCGLKLDLLKMTKTTARANNIYSDGWSWEFDLTIWNMNENNLKMKFALWSGATTFSAASNMQYSANGTTWQNIASDNSYDANGLNIAGIDTDSVASGRQLKILVRLKVPIGTQVGQYNSSYGILTE